MFKIRKIIIIAYLLICITCLYSLVENNDLYNEPYEKADGSLVRYHDVQLNEKNGTYGYDSYLRTSYFMFFAAVGTGDFTETGVRFKMMLDYPELGGFFFNGDIFMSKTSLTNITTGDIGWWNSNIPFFGETYLGYKHKYFTMKLGFNNLTSSDAIYNHLIIDDYSGPLFGLQLTSMLSRFFDMELSYNIIRPHQGPWYDGNSDPLDATKIDNIKDDDLYDALYGKSLYTHKINIRPLPWIRVGIMEATYFLGENFNPWFANPFFIYIFSQALDDFVASKAGHRYNVHAANLLAGIDFNIGFHGWRVYGEFMFDDSNGELFKFQDPSHPDKFAFTIGGELRGYLFTKYYNYPRGVEYFLNNLYFNIEYGMVSKYNYGRDYNFYYEYVRDEYIGKTGADSVYDTEVPEEELGSVNRIGNHLGFMYGPNSDCIDVAIGWRTDLWNVKEYDADYQGDVFFHSKKQKRLPKRLFKIQLHYRHYRLGDERDVTMPFYYGEHPDIDLDSGETKEKDDRGTSRGTEFLVNVLEIGDIVDLEIYGDIFRISRFVFGMETKFRFFWDTKLPYTYKQKTEFDFQWDFGIVISW